MGYCLTGANTQGGNICAETLEKSPLSESVMS